jgi:hypothetical protein
MFVVLTPIKDVRFTFLPDVCGYQLACLLRDFTYPVCDAGVFCEARDSLGSPSSPARPLAQTTGARWVWSRGRRYHVYMKLDPVKVKWIIKQKEKGVSNRTIADSMNVSVRRAQELWSAYSRSEGEGQGLSLFLMDGQG